MFSNVELRTCWTTRWHIRHIRHIFWHYYSQIVHEQMGAPLFPSSHYLLRVCSHGLFEHMGFYLSTSYDTLGANWSILLWDQIYVLRCNLSICAPLLYLALGNFMTCSMVWIRVVRPRRHQLFFTWSIFFIPMIFLYSMVHPSLSLALGLECFWCICGKWKG